MLDWANLSKHLILKVLIWHGRLLTFEINKLRKIVADLGQHCTPMVAYCINPRSNSIMSPPPRYPGAFGIILTFSLCGVLQHSGSKASCRTSMFMFFYSPCSCEFSPEYRAFLFANDWRWCFFSCLMTVTAPSIGWIGCHSDFFYQTLVCCWSLTGNDWAGEEGKRYYSVTFDLICFVSFLLISIPETFFLYCCIVTFVYFVWSLLSSCEGSGVSE